MPKANSIKKPTVSGISPELKLNTEECKKLKIDPILCGLKIKHWANVVKVAEYALKNNRKLKSEESTLRGILSFFSNVKLAYSTNMALSRYSEACKKYLSSPDTRTKLQNAIAVNLNVIKTQIAQENAENKADLVRSLRSKTQAQKKLAEAAKEYQSALFEAESLLKNIDDVISNPSTQEDEPIQIPHQNEIHERDNVFTMENKSESLGKRIKQVAISIHKEYANEIKVSSELKIAMELGLSSILDLTNEQDAYQKFIFSNQEWEKIKQYFNDKFQTTNTSTIPAKLVTIWSTLVQLATKRGPFIALKYLSKIQSLESTSEEYFTYLEIFKHVLYILHTDASLITNIVENTGSISEQDVYTLWFPIIKKIISIKKITRMKQGETMNAFTTKRKQIRYHDYDKIKGFKIDVRLLLDYHKQEIDLCAGEVTINAFDLDKVTHDRSKVIREAKEICDHHIEAGLGSGSIGWGLQICGLEMRVLSVHLFRDGLYIAVCQGMLYFPQNIHELPNFIDTLKGLVFLIERNEVEATEIIGLYDKIHKSYSPSLDPGCSTSGSMSSESIFTSPTYYTPPSENRTISVTLTELFINTKRQLFQEKVIIGEDPPKTNALDVELGGDLFGWVELNDGAWFNSVTGETTEASPYE